MQVPLLKCVTKEVTNVDDVVVRDMNNIFAARDSGDEKRIFFFEAELKVISWFVRRRINSFAVDGVV